METRLCQAVTKAGKPCRSWPINGTGYCSLHGPGAREVQRKGGLHRSLQHRIQHQQNPEMQGVLELLIRALNEVHDGQLGASSGSAMASLGASILKVREQGLLELRIEALEKRAKADRRQ